MKTFLLGCGAQKSGTTWLANNLCNSAEYWDGGIKEWRFWKHYFDNESRLSRIQEMEKMLHSTSSPAWGPTKAKLNWRISALQNPELFLQKISDVFIAKSKAKILADMTPANGKLQFDEFTHIKDYFNRKGIVVKPLLIMRDPFERIWSAVRMRFRNQYPDQFQKNEQFICDKLLETYRLETVEKKTRYEAIIENLESVFDKEDIYYEFSERLFSQKSLDGITNHLGITNLSQISNSPNPSPKLVTVPHDVKREIVHYYKDTFLSIFNKFGEEVKDLWKESFDLL